MSHIIRHEPSLFKYFIDTYKKLPNIPLFDNKLNVIISKNEKDIKHFEGYEYNRDMFIKMWGELI